MLSQTHWPRLPSEGPGLRIVDPAKLMLYLFIAAVPIDCRVVELNVLPEIQLHEKCALSYKASRPVERKSNRIQNSRLCRLQSGNKANLHILRFECTTKSGQLVILHGKFMIPNLYLVAKCRS